MHVAARAALRCSLLWLSCADAPTSAPLAADPEDPLRVTEATRALGLVVLRGTAVMVIAPLDGTEEIANPFAAPEDSE